MQRRSSSHQSHSRIHDTTLLSGWLFADLLLGLALIFLVTAPAGSFAPLPPTPSATLLPTYTPNPTYTVLPTYTPNPTYTPLSLPITITTVVTPTLTAHDVVLSTHAREFMLHADANALLSDDAVVRQQERARLQHIIQQEFAELQNKRAGIVLTFGTAATPDDGGAISQAINQLLQESMPTLFADAVMRDFHTIEGNPLLRGTVDIEVYLIAQPSY